MMAASINLLATSLQWTYYRRQTAKTEDSSLSTNNWHFYDTQSDILGRAVNLSRSKLIRQSAKGYCLQYAAVYSWLPSI